MGANPSKHRLTYASLRWDWGLVTPRTSPEMNTPSYIMSSHQAPLTSSVRRALCDGECNALISGEWKLLKNYSRKQFE